MKKNIILGIESSCDETAVAIVMDGYRVLANEVSSQMELHSRYGGVVPEVASRMHLESLPILIHYVLLESQIHFEDLTGIAVTSSPGLIGALLVGLSVAKGLAFRLHVPLSTVHHIEAHLYAAQLDASPVIFPALGLVVSGGHTELYHMETWGEYRLLAATRDDAAGEAFDKVAKLMGLGYPGGPMIENLAKRSPETTGFFSLSKMKDKSQDFSFSGLKTAVMLEVKRTPLTTDNNREKLSARFQNTVVQEIISRVGVAMEELKPKSLVVGGGVACNETLRDTLKIQAERFGAVLRVPPKKYCSDNAAMIAGLGAYQISKGKIASLDATALPQANLC